MSDIDLVKKVRVYAEEAEKNGFEVLTVPLRDLFPLLGRMEAAERRVAELENDESRQRLANAEHQLYMKDLAINNIKASRRAQFKKRQAAERERDDLRAEQAEHDEQIARMEGKFSLAKRALDSKTARCEKAEAELRRRDAAAGEPYGYVHKSLYEAVGSAGLSNDHEAYRDSPTHIALYTAAQPAVLPPKYADELTERAELIEAYSKTQCEIAQELGCDSDNESILKAIYELKERGALQQKVVELPEPVKWPEVPCRYFSEDQVFLC